MTLFPCPKGVTIADEACAVLNISIMDSLTPVSGRAELPRVAALAVDVAVLAVAEGHRVEGLLAGGAGAQFTRKIMLKTNVRSNIETSVNCQSFLQSFQV